MDADVIPLHVNDHGYGIKSIVLNRPSSKSLLVVFINYSEVEERLQEGWTIAKEQRCFEDWAMKA